MDARYVLRCWSSRIRTFDEEACGGRLHASALTDYAAIAGNVDAEVLMRLIGDGTTEVTMLSWWTSMSAIATLADPEFERTRYYANNERFFLDEPRCARHYRVIAGSKQHTLAKLQAQQPLRGQSDINY